MELKKHPKADLEKSRGIFLMIGLILALTFVIALFENTSRTQGAEDLGQLENVQVEEEQIPVTRQDVAPPPPPPQETVSDVIEILDDKIKIEEDLDIDLESEEETVIEFQDIQMVEEEEEETEQIFMIVEDMPEFPGGEIALRKYIAENIRYPEMAKENDIQGTVYVRFVVTKSGSIGRIEILRGVDPLLDKEAIRVVKTLPKWKPGKQRGKSVNVSYSMPIKFQLQ